MPDIDKPMRASEWFDLYHACLSRRSTLNGLSPEESEQWLYWDELAMKVYTRYEASLEGRCIP